MANIAVRPCEICGQMTLMHTNRQKYCPECALKMKHWRANEYKRAEVKKTPTSSPKGKGYAVPRETPEWSTKGKSLELIVAEAKRFGLSYGQYMAAIQSNGIEHRLIVSGFTPKQWKKLLREAEQEVRARK